jgi:tRNA threonylcarbamoyladenosine biosynthesis protein TsaB
MTILALEFSSSQRSVAVLRGDEPYGSHFKKSEARGARPSEIVVSEAIETGGQGTRAFSLIEQVLTEAKIEREQIDVIAVGLGPGSYTGIRVALSIAQGWQLARDVKLLGISSVECLAAQAQSEKIFGRVNVVIDAQRNEFYRAAYEISQNARKEIEPLQITGPAEIQSRTITGKTWIGPEATRWFPSGRVIFPRATMLGRLAAGRNDFISGDKLTPIYLRTAYFVKAPPFNPVAR